MKLFSFVVTPSLINGRKLKGIIRLHAYQNIEYHRYYDDIILFIGTQNRGSGKSPFLTYSQNYDFGNKYAYFSDSDKLFKHLSG